VCVIGGGPSRRQWRGGIVPEEGGDGKSFADGDGDTEEMESSPTSTMVDSSSSSSSSATPVAKSKRQMAVRVLGRRVADVGVLLVLDVVPKCGRS